MSGVKGGVGRREVAPVESEREKRLRELSVAAWRRHLMEAAQQPQQEHEGMAS